MCTGEQSYPLSMVFMQKMLTLCMIAILPTAAFSKTPFERLQMNTPVQHPGTGQEEAIPLFTRNTRQIKAERHTLAIEYDISVVLDPADSYIYFPCWEKRSRPYYYNFLFRYKLF